MLKSGVPIAQRTVVSKPSQIFAQSVIPPHPLLQICPHPTPLEHEFTGYILVDYQNNQLCYFLDRFLPKITEFRFSLLEKKEAKQILTY